jgi:hypothetical protein
MRVGDAGKFMQEIVGTDGEFTADEISFQIRNVIVQEVSQILAKSGMPVLDMAANTANLGALITKAIEGKVAEYGLTLPEFYIENISLPEEVEKALDKRTSMGVVGDLNKYMQFNAAEGLAQPNSAMGATMGAAMGAGMAAVAGPWGAAPQSAPTPPPPPSAKAWHLAVNGETKGPFTESDLAQMAATGALTAASHVWTAGQDGWKTVTETELSRLIAAVPPPPPKA